jgi:AcrR family transcriptional regulator
MAEKTFQPHYATAKDARVLQTRESLRAAFLKLLNKRDLNQISIRDIASEAGVGYTTVYRHFTKKEELLNYIAIEEVKKLIALALPLLSRADTRTAALSLCREVAKHKTIWRSLLTGGAANVLRQEFINQALQIAADWEAPQDWIPTEIGVSLAASSTIELLACWLKQAKPISADKIAVIFDHVVIKPITTKPTP